MWLGKQVAGQKTGYSSLVDRGTVTQNQEVTGVLLEGERRELQLVSPSGYRWKPAVGQEVLVLQDGQAQQQIVGVMEDNSQITAGDVEIYASGGAKINLSGDVLSLSGKIYVNGESLEDYIRRISGT